MNNSIVYSVSVIVAAVAGLLLGYTFWHTDSVNMAVGTSPAGTTSSTAKFAGIVAVLTSPGVNATSSSILNGSSNDYFITAIRTGCENVGTSLTAYSGAGLASLTLSIATSSTSGPAANANANLVGGSAIVIATTTTNFVFASSTGITPGNTGVGDIWKSGSYLTFTTNATNTATCTFGVDYISS